MQVRDVMTTAVITVTPDTPVEDIARRLLEHHISGVPVVAEDGRLVGIVSEGDLVRRLGEEGWARSWWLQLLTTPEAQARSYVRTHGRRARDVMSVDLVTARPEMSVAEAARLLEAHRVKRLPVVDAQGRLVGVVSRADLLRAVAAAGTREQEAPVDDRSLRERVLKALDETGIPYQPYVNVVVHDGEVHLWGWVSSREESEALRVAAENVPGVRRVETHLGLRPALLGL